jgi:hypothetical protein
LGVLYAASDQVNLQGGCFAPPELQTLADLVVGAPVMVGHQKQELPIGRVFQAEIVTRDDSPWLKVYFYWSRKQSGADELKAGIESGIYSECSLGFQYGRPECAICRADMRHCRHRIGQAVQLGGRDIKAFFYYKELARVLEISLVYRGAVEGTRIEALGIDLGETPQSLLDPFWREGAKPVFRLTQLNEPVDELVVEPLYHGLWCLLECDEGKLTATTKCGEQLDYPVLATVPAQVEASSFSVLAQLFPAKGSSRLPLTELQANPDVRVRVALFDLYELDGHDLRELPLAERKTRLASVVKRSHEVLAAPYTIVSPHELDKVQECCTGLGAIISLSQSCNGAVCEYRRQPLLRVRVAESEGKLVAEFVQLEGGQRPLLVGPRRHLTPGGVVWVRSRSDGSPGFEFVDICSPGSSADSTELLRELAQSSTTARFHLLRDQEGDSWLCLSGPEGRQLLRIRKLGFALLKQKRRFWCDFVELDAPELQQLRQIRLVDEGQARLLHNGDRGARIFHLQGKKLGGEFVVQPLRLGNRHAHLFFAHQKGEGFGQ